MGSMSIWHWVIVALVVMLLFGKGRLSDMMGDLAKGIKSFKAGMADDPMTSSSPTAPPPPLQVTQAAPPHYAPPPAHPAVPPAAAAPEPMATVPPPRDPTRP